jgi:hypothetical protein
MLKITEMFGSEAVVEDRRAARDRDVARELKKRKATEELSKKNESKRTKHPHSVVESDEFEEEVVVEPAQDFPREFEEEVVVESVDEPEPAQDFPREFEEEVDESVDEPEPAQDFPR